MNSIGKFDKRLGKDFEPLSAVFIVDASDVVSTTNMIPSIDLESICADIAVGQQSIDVLANALSQLDILAGDADQNGTVEFNDFLALAGNFGQTDVGYAGGDLNCNGEVEFSDFLTLAGNFGQQSVASVPEPSAIIMLLCGLLGISLNKKRRMAKMST